MAIMFRIFIYFVLIITSLVFFFVFLKKAKKIKFTTKCEDCGNELKEFEKVCSKCGNPINNSEKQKSLYFVIVGVSAATTLFFGLKALRLFLLLFFKISLV